MKRRMHRTVALHDFKCPFCTGTYTLDPDEEAALHSLPVCAEFAVPGEGALEFAVKAREAWEKRGVKDWSVKP